MPSDLEQIQTIRQQSLAQLATLRTSPKPSYTIDGQQVNWESYARSLQATIDWCDAKLSDDQPFEQHNRWHHLIVASDAGCQLCTIPIDLRFLESEQPFFELRPSCSTSPAILLTWWMDQKRSRCLGLARQASKR